MLKEASPQTPPLLSPEQQQLLDAIKPELGMMLGMIQPVIGQAVSVQDEIAAKHYIDYEDPRHGPSLRYPGDFIVSGGFPGTPPRDSDTSFILREDQNWFLTLRKVWTNKTGTSFSLQIIREGNHAERQGHMRQTPGNFSLGIEVNEQGEIASVFVTHPDLYGIREHGKPVFHTEVGVVPFRIYVAPGDDAIESRGERLRDHLLHAWGKIAPKLKREIETALQKISEKLPQKHPVQILPFEPQASEHRSIILKTLSGVGLVKSRRLEAADLAPQHALAIRNIASYLSMSSDPSMETSRALEVLKEAGFEAREFEAQSGVVCVLIETRPTAALTGAGTTDLSPDELHQTLLAAAHHACSVEERNWQIPMGSRAGFTRGEAEGLAQQIAEASLGVSEGARLPFYVEYALTKDDGHAEMGRGKSYEWMHDWRGEGADAVGLIAGGRGMESFEHAPEQNSAFPNVGFRIVVDLDRVKLRV